MRAALEKQSNSKMKRLWGGGGLCAREGDELLSRRGYKSFILVPCSPF